MAPRAHVEDIPPRYEEGALGWGHDHQRTAHIPHHGTASSADSFQRVLSIRARVDRAEVPSFIRDALREIRACIEEHHVDIEGPPFSISHPAPGNRLDVEVGWPVGLVDGCSGRIACRELPAGLVRRGWDHT